MIEWKRYKKVALLLTIVAFLICLILFAPHYLTYADIPTKSDAVILLLGEDVELRDKEAKRLIGENHSQYLLIPANGKILCSTERKDLAPIKLSPSIKLLSREFRKDKGKFRYYEETHMEMLNV